jgi:hypothetical protein
MLAIQATSQWRPGTNASCRVRKWLILEQIGVCPSIDREHSKIVVVSVPPVTFTGFLSFESVCCATTVRIPKNHKWMCDAADQRARAGDSTYPNAPLDLQ